MDVNEVATRLLRRYWLVLLVAVAVPALATGAYVLRQPPTYTAHGRIVASATIPRAQAEAAAVVSQVQALATSRDVVAKALTDGGLNRSADTVVKAVTVTGLGTSAVVDIGYTDRDRAMAQQVDAAVVTAVAKQLDAARIGGLPDVLRDIDNQLTDLATKRAPIAAEAAANVHDLVAQNRLAGIDRLISDLSGDRNRLAEEAAAAGHATVLASPALPPSADPKGLVAKLGVAVILGLALGLVLVGFNETVRPSVSGTVRVGRLLEVPMLGTLSPDPAALADIGRRIRLAARRANVATVVLVRPNRSALPPELVDRIEAASLRPDSVPGRVSIPIDTGDTQVIGGSVAGAERPADPHAVSSQNGSSAGEAGGAGAAPGPRGPVGVLSVPETLIRAPRLRRVCAINELDPSAESDRIGLVVLAGGSTRLSAVDGVRDLMTASGWPLLGVLGDGGRR